MLPIGPSEPPPLGHDPEKWEPVFGKIMLNKELERDDDPKKNHPALGSVDIHWSARNVAAR